MKDDDGFDSLDMEFENAPKPFTRAGNTGIGQIIDYAFEDGKTSKKASKQLTNARRSIRRRDARASSGTDGLKRFENIP